MRSRLVALAVLLLVLGLDAVLLWSQPRARRAATVAALRNFPAFYHGQAVLVRGDLRASGQRALLTSMDDVVSVLTRERLPGDGAYDVRGDVVDIGRVTPDDPRLAGVDLRVLGIDPDERWPRQGEIVILRATSFDPAEPLPAPGVRAIALDPHRYEGQRVTVSGEFRGRNLYGDLPQAPGAASEPRADFVLRSADAAIWVLGRRPRGRGFSFDVTSRIDTRRWLEVSGVVHHERGLAWIRAEELREVEPRQEHLTRELPPPLPAIPPEVLFSVPAEGETDVSRDASVRIQFSRDLDPESLKGRIRATYLGAESIERGEPQPPALPASVRYDPGRRVVEISFDTLLERFRTVTVELLEGITGTDGGPLEPWTLTFSVGG